MEHLLSIMQKHYQEWEQNPMRQTSGYEYEKSFTEMWQALGNKVLQQSVGKLSTDKNAKKNFKHDGAR
jgi:hypothetical protein